MRTLIVVGLLAIASPANAQSCFESDGASVRFLEDGENTVLIQTHDGVELTCSWMATPDGPDVQDIRCDGGLGGSFYFKEVAGKGRAMIFEDQVWDDAECP